MTTNRIIYLVVSIIGLVILVFIIALLIFIPTNRKLVPLTLPVVTSFETCVSAGFPVMESYPRQCRTSDGKTYAEELAQNITYSNSSVDLIVVDLPFPGAVTGKEFVVTGKARGTWYFEASFPVQILDKDGKVLVALPAQAQGDWMTENFVPFKVVVKVPNTYIGPATLVLRKDNPSGLPEKEAYISFPITIEY